MTEPVALETPQLVLRELRDDDVSAVHAYASAAEVVRYLDWGPNAPEDTMRFLAAARAAREAIPRTAYHLAIALKATGRLIGGCRIEIRNAANGAGDLGYVLGRPHWGHGYATEATRALVGFGFESLALHRIWATCDVRNAASARVLEKLGMKREGQLRHDARRKGEWRDSYYAISRRSGPIAADLPVDAAPHARISVQDLHPWDGGNPPVLPRPRVVLDAGLQAGDRLRHRVGEREHHDHQRPELLEQELSSGRRRPSRHGAGLQRTGRRAP